MISRDFREIQTSSDLVTFKPDLDLEDNLDTRSPGQWKFCDGHFPSSRTSRDVRESWYCKSAGISWRFSTIWMPTHPGNQCESLLENDNSLGVAFYPKRTVGRATTAYRLLHHTWREFSARISLVLFTGKSDWENVCECMLVSQERMHNSIR